MNQQQKRWFCPGGYWCGFPIAWLKLFPLTKTFATPTRGPVIIIYLACHGIQNQFWIDFFQQKKNIFALAKSTTPTVRSPPTATCLTTPTWTTCTSAASAMLNKDSKNILGNWYQVQQWPSGVLRRRRVCRHELVYRVQCLLNINRFNCTYFLVSYAIFFNKQQDFLMDSYSSGSI